MKPSLILDSGLICKVHSVAELIELPSCGFAGATSPNSAAPAAAPLPSAQSSAVKVQAVMSADGTLDLITINTHLPALSDMCLLRLLHVDQRLREAACMCGRRWDVAAFSCSPSAYHHCFLVTVELQFIICSYYRLHILRCCAAVD